jgi:hypothetical protein
LISNPRPSSLKSYRSPPARQSLSGRVYVFLYRTSSLAPSYPSLSL